MRFGDGREPDDGLGPAVSRPRGAEWRALQADGVVWEGQVLLVGDEVDLAARLVVTHRRLAFVRGGSVALEVPRSWLRPAPRLRSDGTLLLSVSAPGASIFAEPETIPVYPRDGAQATGQLMAMLAGSGARRVALEAPGVPAPRALPPLPDSGLTRSGSGDRGSRSSLIDAPSPAVTPSREEPRFDRRQRDSAGNGAGLDRFRSERPPTDAYERLRGHRNGHRWDQDLSWPAPEPTVEAAPPPPSAHARPALPPPAPVPVSEAEPPTEGPVRRPAPPVAVGRDRDWNLEPIKGLMPREGRRRRGWSIRIGGFFVLLGIAAVLFLLSVHDGRTPGSDRGQAALAPTAAVAGGGRGGVGGAAAEEGVPPIPTGVGGSTEAVIPAPPSAPPDQTTAPQTQAPVEVAEGTSVPAPPTATTPPPTATAEPTATTPAPTATAAPPPPAAAATDATRVDASAQAETAPTAARGRVTSGTFRFAVAEVARGEMLPQYALAGSGANEWVAVVVDVSNWTGVRGRLAMDDFALQTPDGEPVATLDEATTTVAKLKDLIPAAGRGDVVELGPNAERRLALAFRVPAGSGDLVLRAGDALLALDPSG